MDARVRSVEVERRLQELSALFDIEGIVQRDASAATIRNYYKRSALGYKLFHSSEGSIHMSLRADGDDAAPDYSQQASMVLSSLPNGHGLTIVELGCGNGYNILQMAEARPESTFIGVDLSQCTCAQHPVHSVNVGYRRRRPWSLTLRTCHSGRVKSTHFSPLRPFATHATPKGPFVRHVESSRQVVSSTL